MLTVDRCRTYYGVVMAGGLFSVLVASAEAQVNRGPSDYLTRDQYGNRYRDRVFSGSRDAGDRSLSEGVIKQRQARARRDAADDDASFSEAYPYIPPSRRPGIEEEPVQELPRPADRYRRPNDGVVRNNYAGVPVYRHYYGGVDRYDSPGYLDDAGRASALSNGYSRRGVEEFSDSYGRGVRTNDVYPLQRDVNPRRYRGRDLNGSLSSYNEDTSGASGLEDFVRSEMSVRPGANLRVSSTGTYTLRNYLDQGNQVHARFRLPVHKRWEYGRGP
jgi:hypothetical protein